MADVFARWETKFILDAEMTRRAREVFAERLKPDPYFRQTICNVYYDTPNFELARRTLDHPPYREKIRESYRRAAEEIGADGVIPSGEAMLHLAKSGVRAHRDGFHASLAAGRYAIALTWAGALLGQDPRENTFSDFDIPATAEEILAAKEAAAFALGL